MTELTLSFTKAIDILQFDLIFISNGVSEQ